MNFWRGSMPAAEHCCRAVGDPNPGKQDQPPYCEVDGNDIGICRIIESGRSIYKAAYLVNPPN